MSKESLEQFKEAVLGDPTLQERLKSTTDEETFLRLAVSLGEESGYDFTEEEVREMMLEQAESRNLESPTLENVILQSQKPGW